MISHRLSLQAEAELDDTWYYIVKESGSVEIADRFIDTLTRHFYLLAKNPHIGRRRDQEFRFGIRSFPVGNYLILYQIEEESVLIMHVIRGSRDIKALLDSP